MSVAMVSVADLALAVALGLPTAVGVRFAKGAVELLESLESRYREVWDALQAARREKGA